MDCISFLERYYYQFIPKVLKELSPQVSVAAPRLARARDPEAMPLRLTEKSDICAKTWSADVIFDDLMFILLTMLLLCQKIIKDNLTLLRINFI